MMTLRYSKWSQRLPLCLSKLSHAHLGHWLAWKLKKSKFSRFFVENMCFLVIFWWNDEISIFSKNRSMAAMMTSSTSNESLRCHFSLIIVLRTHLERSLSSKSIFSIFRPKVYIWGQNDWFLSDFGSFLSKSMKFQKITKIDWKVQF